MGSRTRNSLREATISLWGELKMTKAKGALPQEVMKLSWWIILIRPCGL
jgi:hypothetical protein